MAKILKHFGLGTKKSNISPAHKCKLETDSPKVSRSNADKNKKVTKDEGSNNSASPLSPVKSSFDFNSGESSAVCDFKQTSKGTDNSKQSYKEVVNDDDVPVYSAVIKDKITPDSILNEITLKLNVSEEKANAESLSTFGKSSNKSVEGASEKKSIANEKLPDVIKADNNTSSNNSNDHSMIEYDDPYEEGPIMRPSDSGMSSLKSSTTTLNHKTNEDGDTLERPGGGGSGDYGEISNTKCEGETQIGFETLRSWNVDNEMSKSGTTETNPDTNSDNDTLEGSEPPPIPAKTYNTNQDLPPPPPNFFTSDLDVSGRGNYDKQPPRRDQPLDLSGRTPTDGRPESWGVRRFEDDHLTLPTGPPPEPPIRLGETANSYNRNNNTTNSNTIGSTSNNNTGVDLRSRHESLMMRSAYGLDGAPPPSNYHMPYYHPSQHPSMPPPQQPQRHYYSQQQAPYSPHPQHSQQQQQHSVRQHYSRSGSVRSIDYRHDYEEPWDHHNPANFQTAPDGMRCNYNIVGQQSPHHYNSRSSLLSTTSSSSWAPPYPPDPIDPRIPLEEQFWFHGTISRTLAEGLLRSQREGAYLVRMSESNRLDLSLSVKSSRGFMHMKIVTNQDGRYILGQFSQPFTSIPLMIHHYTLHKLPIKGAEHVSLTTPVANDMM